MPEGHQPSEAQGDRRPEGDDRREVDGRHEVHGRHEVGRTDPSHDRDQRGDVAPFHVAAGVWGAVAGLGLVGTVVAIVVGTSPTIQALAVAVAFGGAALMLHARGADADASEIHHERPGTGAEAEEKTVAVLGRPVTRRSLLGGVLVAALAGGVLLRWLGPRATTSTPWQAGRRLVTNDGDPLRPADVPVGGAFTVWPDGAIDQELAAAMLIRLREQPLPPTAGDAVVDDTLVCYSRICTHAGCPVALYRDRDQSLFCPCHQATFDATSGARPTFGPAYDPLPQLPLGIDDDGFLIATGDFPTRPGPTGGRP